MMIKKTSMLWLLLCSLASPCAFAGDTVERKTAGYLLHPGDTVQIMVWKDESLQKELKVLPDGYVTFPLVGRVKLAGLGVTEAEQALAAKLVQFMPEPIVTVVVTAIEGNKAYVIGNVATPGAKIMTGPTSVLQALSLAGGLTKFADEDSIKIVRENDGVIEVLPVNYKDIAAGKDMSSNLELKAGDTILVP